jgi:hypothetical protein
LNAGRHNYSKQRNAYCIIHLISPRRYTSLCHRSLPTRSTQNYHRLFDSLFRSLSTTSSRNVSPRACACTRANLRLRVSCPVYLVRYRVKSNVSIQADTKPIAIPKLTR